MLWLRCITNPLQGKRKVKINLIRGNSVHSKENSGILPSVSLPSQLCGQRAWGLEPRGPKLEFWLSLSSVTMGTTVQGAKKSLPYRTATRVHEKRCKRHDAAGGFKQKQQACPLSSLTDSNPTRPPAQWPAWTSQKEAPGPTSFTPRSCPLRQRQDPFLGVGAPGREVPKTLPHPAADTVHSCYCLISPGPGLGSTIIPIQRSREGIGLGLSHTGSYPKSQISR